MLATSIFNFPTIFSKGLFWRFIKSLHCANSQKIWSEWCLVDSQKVVLLAQAVEHRSSGTLLSSCLDLLHWSQGQLVWSGKRHQRSVGLLGSYQLPENQEGKECSVWRWMDSQTFAWLAQVLERWSGLPGNVGLSPASGTRFPLIHFIVVG